MEPCHIQTKAGWKSSIALDRDVTPQLQKTTCTSSLTEQGITVTTRQAPSPTALLLCFQKSSQIKTVGVDKITLASSPSLPLTAQHIHILPTLRRDPSTLYLHCNDKHTELQYYFGDQLKSLRYSFSSTLSECPCNCKDAAMAPCALKHRKHRSVLWVTRMFSLNCQKSDTGYLHVFSRMPEIK